MIALWTLVTLVVLSPWAFGGVQPGVGRALVVLALLGIGVQAALQVRRGFEAPPAAARFGVAVGLLALAQLVPLPEPVHALLAPGSHPAWFPPEGSAAANYSFDVTPARLVTGLITERGVCAASREGVLGLYPEKKG